MPDNDTNQVMAPGIGAYKIRSTVKGDTSASAVNTRITALDRGGDGTESLVKATQPLYVEQGAHDAATYSGSTTAFTPFATSTTDCFQIIGSATKTVRVLRLEIMGASSSAVGPIVDVIAIKRSTASTLTSVTVTPIVVAKHDSGDSAATAVVNKFTVANPDALGTTAGVVKSGKLYQPVTPPTATDFPSNPGLVWDFTNGGTCKGVILRGVAQQLALNLNGVTQVAGQTLDINITFVEDAS